MKLPRQILIKEMAPRDGLQSASMIVPTDRKIAFIERLIESGHRYVEITAFVNPKMVPQMADAEAVARHFQNDPRAVFSALVPNKIGMEKALACGLKEVAVFTAASETFNQNNIHCSILESFERFKDIFSLAKRHKIRVRGYLSTAFVCPYEGVISPKTSVDIASKLLKMGCYEVSIGDTLGLATPIQVKQLFSALKKKAPIQRWAAHFHDTYRFGLTNVMAALESGVKVFDASAGGIGGCPFAPGAKGNVATEDVAFLCDRLGIKTGIDLSKLKSISLIHRRDTF